jgi:YegS/Rv2252/BmrU family lipid kinase
MPAGALYFNPSSGDRDPEIASAVRERAAAEGIEVVKVSEGLEIGADIRERMGRGEKLFIAAGGDGTIHTVVQALVNTEATLGILPVGTFNHFARDLGIPLGWSEAFDVAVEGKRIEVSAGSVNGHYFLNNLSIGLYPHVAEERERLRQYSKWKAYRKAAFSALREFHHVSLVVETPHHIETIKTHVFMVAVNPYDLESFGIVAPRVTLEGGQLSVYWLPYMQKAELVRVLARYFRGKAIPGTDFRSMYTPELRVQTSRSKLKVGIDGELYEMEPPLVIRPFPKSVRVRVPADRGDRLA